MASITLTAGSITATKNASNATVSALIDDYIAAQTGILSGASNLPANPTGQQKADWVLSDLVRHIREVANGQAVRVAGDTAAATEKTRVDGRDWA